MRLTRAGEQAIRDLIERYRLHDPPSAIVDIRSVAHWEGWTVTYDWRMRRLWGLARIDTLTIKLNPALSPSYQRMVIAHELGHWLNGDFQGALSGIELCTAREWDWFCDRMERRAYLAAAKILVKPWVIRECGGDPGAISAVADVPDWLAELALR